MNPGAPIVLDGSYGEGGGALLRTALTMATLTQQPMKLVGVRGATKFPGLNPEDLMIARALAECCAAETIGLSPRVNEFSFLPTRRPKSLSKTLEMREEDGQMGQPSAPVVLTSLIPVLARTGAYSTLSVEGETYGHGVLSYDPFAMTTIGAYRRLGLYAFPDLIQAGYGRGSHGEIRLEIEPSAIHGVNWSKRGSLVGIRASVVTSELDSRVSERGVSHLQKLASSAKMEVAVDAWAPASASAGAFVYVQAEFENGFGGAGAMGGRGIRMEAVVQQAFDGFLEWMSTEATVDSHLADQLIVSLAIAEGDSTIEIDRLTPRLLTSIWVIKQFLPIRITVKGVEGGPGSVTIRK